MGKKVFAMLVLENTRHTCVCRVLPHPSRQTIWREKIAAGGKSWKLQTLVFACVFFPMFVVCFSFPFPCLLSLPCSSGGLTRQRRGLPCSAYRRYTANILATATKSIVYITEQIRTKNNQIICCCMRCKRT
jgi:hypothetical protein